MPLRIWTTTTTTTNSKRIRDDTPPPPSPSPRREEDEDEPPPVVIDQRQRGQRQQQQERFSYPLPVGATGVVMQGYPPRVKRVEASSPLADKIRPDQVVHAVRIPGRDEYNVQSGGFTARSVQRYLRQHDHVPGRTLVVKDAPPTTPDAEDQHYNYGRSRTLFGSLNNVAGWNYHHHFYQGTTISSTTSTTIYSPRGSMDNGFVRFPNLFGGAAAAPSLLFPPNGFFSSSRDYNRDCMRRYIDTTTTTKEGSSSSSTSSSSPR